MPFFMPFGFRNELSDMTFLVVRFFVFVFLGNGTRLSAEKQLGSEINNYHEKRTGCLKIRKFKLL